MGEENMKIDTGRLLSVEPKGNIDGRPYWHAIIIMSIFGVLGVLLIYVIAIKEITQNSIPIIWFLIISSLVSGFFMSEIKVKSKRPRRIIYENGFVPPKYIIDESGNQKEIFIKWRNILEIKRVNLNWNKEKWVFHVRYEDKTDTVIIAYSDFHPKKRKQILEFMKKVEQLKLTK